MRDRAVIGVGLGAGLAGISIIFVLDVTGYLAFGHVPGSGSLLASIQQTPPWRRVLALVVAGVIGGVGWYLLRRRGTQIVSDEDAVSGSRMPALKTIMDGLLQMAVIGLGASTAASSHPGDGRAGRGVAERAHRVDGRRSAAPWSPAGAGSGLAAVCNVPLGGAIFALEVLSSACAYQ